MPESALLDRKSLEHKVFRLPLETKVVDENEGIVEALVAVTGNVDDGGDIIVPGAFQFKRDPVIVWSHDLHGGPIAKVLEHEELLPGDPRLPTDLMGKGLGALRFKMQFDLADPDSFKAYRKVVFHESMGWSIGYAVDPNGGFKMLGDGRRALLKITVWEGSPTTFGMNEEARTMSVKSAVADALKDLHIPEERKTSLVDLVAILAAEGEPDPERQEKSWPPLAGSFEEVTERLREVVQTWGVEQYGERGPENDWWCGVEGTFEDTIVVSFRWYGQSIENVTLRFPYVEDADGTVNLGEPEEVEVQSVVAPAVGSKETDPPKPPPAPVLSEKAKAHKPHPFAAADGEENCEVCGQDSESSLHEAEKALAHLKSVQAEIEAEQKAGRVLSAANMRKLEAAMESVQQVLAAATPAEEEDDKKTKVLARRIVGKGQGGTVEAEVPEDHEVIDHKTLMEMMVLAET